ncbi:MAG: hypothetical protein ACI4AK_01485 [Lepagella sp.]
MKHSELITSILCPLADKPQQAYMSNLLQVADILQWILDQTGKASVKMASFSISEEFLRRLFMIKKSGLITDIDIVLDFKATNKTLILWPFIAQTVQNCYLSSSHAKIILVANDQWKISVILSQNLTRGNRFESGFITTTPEIYDTLREQFENVINNQSIPFHDVYCRTIGAN